MDQCLWAKLSITQFIWQHVEMLNYMGTISILSKIDDDQDISIRIDGQHYENGISKNTFEINIKVSDETECYGAFIDGRDLTFERSKFYQSCCIDLKYNKTSVHKGM